MSERRIGFELRNTHNLLRRHVAHTKPPELCESTDIHGWAIHYFYKNQDRDIFQKDFESHFSIRRSTATNMLKRMELNGLILRQAVPYDARLKKIVLTPKASAILQQIEHNISELEAGLCKGISNEELEIFFSVLEKIKYNLEEMQ